MLLIQKRENIFLYISNIHGLLSSTLLYAKAVRIPVSSHLCKSTMQIIQFCWLLFSSGKSDCMINLCQKFRVEIRNRKGIINVDFPFTKFEKNIYLSIFPLIKCHSSKRDSPKWCLVDGTGARWPTSYIWV